MLRRSSSWWLQTACPSGKISPKLAALAQRPSCRRGRSYFLVHNWPQPPVGYVACYLILEIHTTHWRGLHSDARILLWAQKIRHATGTGFGYPAGRVERVQKKSRKLLKISCQYEGGVVLCATICAEFPPFFSREAPHLPPKILASPRRKIPPFLLGSRR